MSWSPLGATPWNFFLLLFDGKGGEGIFKAKSNPERKSSKISDPLGPMHCYEVHNLRIDEHYMQN